MERRKCYVAIVGFVVCVLFLFMSSGAVLAKVDKHVFHIGLVHSKTHILYRTGATLKDLLAKKSERSTRLHERMGSKPPGNGGWT